MFIQLGTFSRKLRKGQFAHLGFNLRLFVGLPLEFVRACIASLGIGDRNEGLNAAIWNRQRFGLYGLRWGSRRRFGSTGRSNFIIVGVFCSCGLAMSEYRPIGIIRGRCSIGRGRRLWR